MLELLVLGLLVIGLLGLLVLGLLVLGLLVLGLLVIGLLGLLVLGLLVIGLLGLLVFVADPCEPPGPVTALTELVSEESSSPESSEPGPLVDEVLSDIGVDPSAVVMSSPFCEGFTRSSVTEAVPIGLSEALFKMPIFALTAVVPATTTATMEIMVTSRVRPENQRGMMVRGEEVMSPPYREAY